MYQSEFDALTAQIARQSKELAVLQPEIDTAQLAIDAAKTAADAAQKAIDDTTNAKKPLDEALALTTSNAEPLLSRANTLRSGVASCSEALFDTSTTVNRTSRLIAALASMLGKDAVYGGKL